MSYTLLSEPRTLELLVFRDSDSRMMTTQHLPIGNGRSVELRTAEYWEWFLESRKGLTQSILSNIYFHGKPKEKEEWNFQKIEPKPLKSPVELLSTSTVTVMAMFGNLFSLPLNSTNNTSWRDQYGNWIVDECINL